MDDFQWLLVALAIIALWTLMVYILHKKGILAKANMSPVGPIVMWKTVKGRRFLDRLARPARFWRAYGDFSIILCLVAMFALMGLLVWEATLVPSIPRENAPTPNLLLGVPGLNPIIPLGYGILGLAIAIVLHEFLHGILARTAKVNLKSLGILLFVFPIGAFVEPDEEELQTMKRRDRARLFAAGPATNMVLALVFAIIFSTVMMGSVRAAHDGVGVTSFSIDGSPAENAGMHPGMIIFRVEGMNVTTANVTSVTDLATAMENTRPGDAVNITAYYRGSVDTYRMTLANDSSTTRGVMGVRLITVTTAYFHPLGGGDYFGSPVSSILNYVTLPFRSLQPLQEPVTDFFVVEGFWVSIPGSVFWTLANCAYWLFWLNIMLGATNALPAIPLDGGYIFKDGFGAFLERVKKGIKPESRDRIVSRVSMTLALFILALILWQFLGPYFL
jgi:membrane-associated protease RseP (regulator of RpoE activity)